MDGNVKDWLVKYNTGRDYGTDDATLFETVQEGRQLWKGEEESHRNWSEYTYVTEVDGTLFGYYGAETTGDMNAEEKGYEQDYDAVFFVEPVRKTTTTYEQCDKPYRRDDTMEDKKTITITIEVEPTSNPRVVKVGDALVVGPVETRRLMMSTAREQVEAAVRALFPGKGE